MQMLNSLNKNIVLFKNNKSSKSTQNTFKREIIAPGEQALTNNVISAEVLNTLINQTTDLITVLSNEGNILFVNSTVERILGFKKEERIGQNALMMIHKDDLPRVYNDFLNVLNSGSSSAISSFRYLKADGTYIFLEASGSCVNDNSGNKYIVIVSRDITARIESEKNIARLSTAVEQSSNTVVITDVDGRIEYVNKKFEDLTGYSIKDVIGYNPNLLRSENTTDEVYKDLWTTILTGKVWEGELKNKKKSGEIYWEKIKITPVIDNNDRITNFIAIKDDITREKKINERLSESLKEKELMLKEKEILLKEKEIMLKEIHHRVKNNLQIVISLLNLQSSSVDDVKLKNQLVISQNRVRSMALIHQLLYKSTDLARINMEDYLLSLSSQLLATYGEIKDRVNIKIKCRNINFSIETAVPFGLLVNELITNSLKHGYPEGRSGKIEIILSNNKDDEYELDYFEDGVGIPMSIINGHVVSFGMNLIEMLVSQLEGNIRLEASKGTNYKINFRGSNYQTRI